MGSAQVQCRILMAGILLYKEGWLSLITTKAGAMLRSFLSYILHPVYCIPHPISI